MVGVYIISLIGLFVIAPNNSCNNVAAKFTKTTSPFSEYVMDIDQGEKLLCFFAPGCDHCMSTAKSLDSLINLNPNFPEIHIVFMDEEPGKIPAFFEFAGREFPYQVMDVAEFWKVLGFDKDTPAIFYLINGNQISFYQGISEEKFDADSLVNDLKNANI